MTNEKRYWSFKLNKSETNKWKDESYPVSIIIRKDGRRKIISLGIGAKPHQWNLDYQRYKIDNRTKDLHQDREKSNYWLDTVTDRCNSIISDWENRNVKWTVSMFETAFINKPKQETVERYLLSHIQYLKDEKKFGTARTFNDCYTVIQKFDKRFKNRVFADIDYNYIIEFVKFLKNDRGLMNNSISVYTRAIRSLLNKSIADSVGCPETYPFSNKYGATKVFKISTELKQKTTNPYIPSEYLIKLRDYKPAKRTHAWAKHLFLFSFFAGGINFKDLSLLKMNNVSNEFNQAGESILVIRYKRSKTDEDIEVIINRDIQKELDYLNQNFAIIEDYLLPVVSVEKLTEENTIIHIDNKRKKCNKFLKEISNELNFPEGIENLSFRDARNSFAMSLLKRGVPIDKISEAMHHADTKTTKIYLDRFSRDDIAEISEGLLDDNKNDNK